MSIMFVIFITLYTPAQDTWGPTSVIVGALCITMNKGEGHSRSYSWLHKPGPGQLELQFNQAPDHAIILLVVISVLFSFIIFILPKGSFHYK